MISNSLSILLEFIKPNPSTAELSNSGTFIFEKISLAKILSSQFLNF